MIEKSYLINGCIVDKETFFKEAKESGLLPKLTEKHVYRKVWEFGTTPDGVHFQRAFKCGIYELGKIFLTVRFKNT